MVETYAAVRRFVLMTGGSRREAAWVFGLSRETVAKMCRYSAPPGYVRGKPAGKPKLGALLGVIEAILEADREAPAKQRHTAKRIFERLRDEPFPGNTILNVNVPDLPIVGISGLSFASLGSKSTDDVAIEIADGSLVLRRRRNASPYDVGSDAAALATGRIAITILELPWSTTDTDNDVIAAIESSWLEFTRAGQRFAGKSIEPDCDVSSRVSN